MPRFVDTNILVYAEDRDAGRKHGLARDLILDLWEARDGVVSVQVLQEFYVTVTRKLRRPLGSSQAREIVEQYLAWRIVDGTGRLLRAAMRRSTVSRLSLWDAMIVEAARTGGCDLLFTEDLSPGQTIAGVRIVNPLEASGTGDVG